MKDQWTGELVGKMHNASVTLEDMARELKCTKAYVSMILNCNRRPAGAQERFEAAFERVLEGRA